MAKVAERMGMVPRSCSNIWGKLKQKIQHNLSLDSLAGGSSPDSPGGSAKRKRGAAAGADGENSSPTKKPRAPRAPRATAAKAKAAPAGGAKGKAKSAATVKPEDDESDGPVAAKTESDGDAGDEAKVVYAEAAQFAGEI